MTDLRPTTYTSTESEEAARDWTGPAPKEHYEMLARSWEMRAESAEKSARIARAEVERVRAQITKFSEHG